MDNPSPQLPPPLDNLVAIKLMQQSVWLLAKDNGPDVPIVVPSGMLLKLIETPFVAPSIPPPPQVITWAG